LLKNKIINNPNWPFISSLLTAEINFLIFLYSPSWCEGFDIVIIISVNIMSCREFIGPLMGAALVELSGFGWANTFTAGLCCAVVSNAFVQF